MAAMLRAAFQIQFCWIYICVLWLNGPLKLSPGVQLDISNTRESNIWTNTGEVHWRFYASPNLNV